MKAEPRPERLAARATGLAGEDRALSFALSRGWQLWGRQLRIGRTEVDLALTADRPGERVLLLLEVKSTRRPQADHALRWSKAQQDRLWRAAELLAVRAKADRVEVALVLVQLGVDRDRLTWLQAEPF